MSRFWRTSSPPGREQRAGAGVTEKQDFAGKIRRMANGRSRTPSQINGLNEKLEVRKKDFVKHGNFTNSLCAGDIWKRAINYS